MFRRGVKLQIIGLLLAILSAFVFAFVVRHVHLVPPLADVTTVPEVRERVAPDFLMLAIALGAGVAGIVSLTSGVSAALVGVMIAVALIPPAATMGIGLAWGQPMVSFGSGVLLLVNVLSINLAALVFLWYKGYRPERWFRRDRAKKALLQQIVTLVVAIVILSAFLGGVTVDSFQRSSTDEAINDDVLTVIEEFETEHQIELIDVEVEYERALPFQDPQRVIITVGVPPGESVSGLAPVLHEQIRTTVNAPVDVEVQYIQIERH